MRHLLRPLYNSLIRIEESGVYIDKYCRYAGTVIRCAVFIVKCCALNHQESHICLWLENVEVSYIEDYKFEERHRFCSYYAVGSL